MELTKKKCVACEGGVPTLDARQIKEYMKEVEDWKVQDKKLIKRLIFKDFVSLIKFINKLAALAESEGHHPDFTVHYNKLDLEVWTHAINGLSKNDFILAAKIDKVFKKLQI